MCMKCVTGNFRYPSSIDTNIKNLYGKFKCQPIASQPIVILLHGWGGDAFQILDTELERIASYGFFAIALGLRGRNGSSGSRDASGKEIYDIYDVLKFLRTTPFYKQYVSQDKSAVVGYSGGGGNALACAAKFPDAFHVIVDYFGISDYGHDPVNSWYYQATQPSFPREVAQSVGGTPDALPDAYLARDITQSITNYNGTLYMFHDTADVLVPYIHSNRVKTAFVSAKKTNCYYNLSNPKSAIRWSHGYPYTNKDLIKSEPAWSNRIKVTKSYTVPASGTVMVSGFIKTKRFEIRLGDMTNDLAQVSYDDDGNFAVESLTGEQSVSIYLSNGKKSLYNSVSDISTISVI